MVRLPLDVRKESPMPRFSKATVAEYVWGLITQHEEAHGFDVTTEGWDAVASRPTDVKVAFGEAQALYDLAQTFNLVPQS
jgi:hypothetical protein